MKGQISSSSRVKNFHFFKSPRPALESTQPPIQWVTSALSQGTIQPGHEFDNSLPASAEVKKTWIYIPTPPFHLLCMQDKYNLS
jgi:hypothetical protein